MSYRVVNKFTGRVLYKGDDKKAAKAAYKSDPTGTWVYKQIAGKPGDLTDPEFKAALCDCRSFEPLKKQ